jgi:uncharacterized protein YaaQ
MMKKLVVTVIQNEVADAVVDALLEAEYRATRLASTGGFLRRGNTTLLIGADEDQVDQVLDLVASTPARALLRPMRATMRWPLRRPCSSWTWKSTSDSSRTALPTRPGQSQRTNVSLVSVWYSRIVPAASSRTR